MKLIDILKEIKIDRPASTGPTIKINDPEEYEAFKNRVDGDTYIASIHWDNKSIGAHFDIDDGQTSVLNIIYEDDEYDKIKDFIYYLNKTKIPYEIDYDFGYIMIDGDTWPKFVKK